jgi:DNA-binding response OmpR family regulator
MSLSTSKQQSRAVQSQRTALVVDDVEEMLDLLEIALKRVQFSVLRASTVADAIGLFEENSNEIDLLMTELHVGDENGLELVRRVRTAKPSLPVLAISGSVHDRRTVASQSGIEFMPKPFSASELRRKLETLFPPDWWNQDKPKG